MRQIDIISTRTGIHYLLVGMDDDTLASFGWQLWITKFGVRMTDFVQAMGLNFITFMGGDLWIHNDDTTNRCNLFGEKRDCVVGIISNENPLKIKLYDSLEVHTDAQWEVSEIIIPATLNYPHGMFSKIPIPRFKMRDGIWQAEFLRNMKTTSGTESVIDAINGEHLKGYCIYMKLKNTDNDEVKLFKVVCNTTKAKVR